ncbi:MAG: elongation factor 1-alpha C-terminal domain-related protein, partial [Methylomonas sp.]
LIKLATRTLPASVAMIDYRIDVNTLEQFPAKQLNLNEIAACTLALNAPVVFDPYQRNKGMGGFIVIDRLSNVTVGAGMIVDEAGGQDWSAVTAEERATRFAQTASIIAFKGGQAKDLAYQLERKLFDTGHASIVLEQANDELTTAIKNAGLISLCLDSSLLSLDMVFDSNVDSLDDIYRQLRERGVIY